MTLRLIFIQRILDWFRNTTYRYDGEPPMAQLLADQTSVSTVSKPTKRANKSLMQPKKALQPWQLYSVKYYPARVKATKEMYDAYLKTVPLGIQPMTHVAWRTGRIKASFAQETPEIKAEIRAMDAAQGTSLESLALLTLPAPAADGENTHVTVSSAGAAPMPTQTPGAGPSNAQGSGSASLSQSPGTSNNPLEVVDDDDEVDALRESAKNLEQAAARMMMEKKLKDREE